MKLVHVVAASLLLALAACSAPTLPLPPPRVESVSLPDASGFVTVDGQVLENAIVLCYNDRTRSGVIVTADEAGLFSLRIQAQFGDYLTVWQEVGNDRSPPVGRTVGDGTAGDGGPTDAGADDAGAADAGP